MDKPVVQTTARRRAPPAKAARSQRSDGESTRTAILDATRRRLVEQGYANLSVRDIAADAGVNHALIGYHFGGKQQLVMAVLDDVNNRLLARQSRMYAQPTRTSEKWHQACVFYEEDLASGYVKLLMELMGASFHDDALKREFTPRMLAWKTLIAQAVEEFAQAQGLQLPVSARAVAAWITWFWVGLEASMALGIAEQDGHQREALEAVHQLLRRAEAKPAKAPARARRKPR